MECYTFWFMCHQHRFIGLTRKPGLSVNICEVGREAGTATFQYAGTETSVTEAEMEYVIGL
jgi:hypothetical protein